MNIEYEDDEWQKTVCGSVLTFDAHLKLEIEFDAREEDFEIERILINNGTKWTRIDDVPEHAWIVWAVHEWANSQIGHSAILDQAAENCLIEDVDPNAEHRLTKSQLGV